MNNLKLDSDEASPARAKPKPRNQKKRKLESTCDEDDAEMDVVAAPLPKSVTSDDVEMQQQTLEQEDTKMCTEKKQAAPGKRLVKVKKTRITTVDGYMQAEDYSSFEE